MAPVIWTNGSAVVSRSFEFMKMTTVITYEVNMSCFTGMTVIPVAKQLSELTKHI